MTTPPRLTPNVGLPNWPAEMMEPANWKWFLAVIDWDWREPSALKALLESGEPIPEVLRAVVESIQSGLRRPRDHRAVNRATITGADRMRIAAEVSNALAVCDVNKFNAARIGDKNGEERKDVVARVKQERADYLEHARSTLALHLLNEEAVEDLVRELRKYAKAWPQIPSQT